MNMKTLTAPPLFQSAQAEIEALGFRISDRPCPGYLPYMVVGGRSNQRWWLIPLYDKQVTVSSMALFQPVLPSAMAIKKAATLFSALGLSSLLSRQKIYMAGTSFFEEIFGSNDLHYAFFTGTESPHRKVAVQVMSRDGGIRGFAKVTQNPSVRPLLEHEADILEYLRTLKLETALAPRVLYSGDLGNTGLLVTDTLKTPSAKTATKLVPAHISFLCELARRTSRDVQAGGKGSAAVLREQYTEVAAGLPEVWQARLQKGLAYLERSYESLRHQVMSHGDFTPWNTFFVNDKLYVFDWEYADRGSLAGYDLIHFLLSLRALKKNTSKTLHCVRSLLCESAFAQHSSHADLFILFYLCSHVLRYVRRAVPVGGKVVIWDGQTEAAAFFDAILD